MSTIKLQSADEQVFEVEVKAVQQSITIKTMLDDLGYSKEEEEEPIPLPNVTGPILKKVIEWIVHHKDDPPVIVAECSEKRTDNISEWDQEFLKIDNSMIFELILASNYLDIKGLLDITCKTVANMIKGKTPEEIRKNFNLEKVSQDKQQDTNESKEAKQESKGNEPKKVKQENKENKLDEEKEDNKEEPMQLQEEMKDENME